MKIIGTICARGGSQGVKHKNIKCLNGKPLIVWSIEHALKSKYIQSVVVSTDSQKIAEISVNAGAVVPELRPLSLSGNAVEKFKVMKYVFDLSCKYFKVDFDLLVDLDCTNPLRNSIDIDNLIENFSRKIHDNSDLMFTVCDARKNPYFNLLEKNNDGRLEVSKKLNNNIIRRQDAPKVYEHVASIYAIRKKYLQKANSLLEGYAVGFDIGQEKSFDIDNDFDWKIIEFLMSKKNE